MILPQPSPRRERPLESTIAGAQSDLYETLFLKHTPERFASPYPNLLIMIFVYEPAALEENAAA